MRLNRFFLLFAAAGWVWVGAASGRDVRNNKIGRSSTRPAVLNVVPLDLDVFTATDGEPTDPTDCARHCAENAEHVFKDCMSHEGAIEDDCHARAQQFLQHCLADQCNDVPDCVEQCHAEAGEAYRTCIEAGESEETCAGDARKDFEDCIAANCPPPPPPTCEEGCQRHAEGVRKECMSLQPSPGEEVCTSRARDAFEVCVRDHCMVPPPLTCANQCEMLAGEVYRHCMGEINNSEVCGARAHGAFQNCLKERCEPQPADCEDRCKHAARVKFEECMSEEVFPPNTEEVCGPRARAFLTMCLRDECGVQPPCEEVCKHRAEEYYHGCVNDPVNPGEPEDCAAEARRRLNECLQNECQHPPDCEEACRDEAEKKFHACMAEDVRPPNTEETCARRARDFLAACLVDRCHHLPPCEGRCRMVAADDFRDCMLGGGTIEACASDALDTMNLCIAHCEQPQTCEEDCRAKATEFVAHCIVETGNFPGCTADGLAMLEKCVAGCPPP